MTDAVGSGSTQPAHTAAARKIADASAPKDGSAPKSAPAKPISPGIFDTASPSEIVELVEKKMYVADATMVQTFKFYDYNANQKPPHEMIVAAKANKEQQELLQQMADELKIRISSLDAKPEGTVAGLKELKDEYNRLQERVQGVAGSRPTGVQLADEILDELEGHATRSGRAITRVELRARAESEFRWAVQSGDSHKISAFKQLLLEQADEAVTAWKEAVKNVDKPGGKPEVIKNFKKNLHAAEAKYKEINHPDYGMHR
jgi:predicted RNase H-like nuclease (RuvC/YqgF family)